MTTFDVKLTKIADDLSTMSENDMGELSMAEAAIFHIAVRTLLDLEEIRSSQEEEA